jgi:hypothetical protein
MISISYIKETKVMRTLVDLGDAQLQGLDELSKKERLSRAALIRRAIDDYLAKQGDKQKGNAFGLWDKRKVDGLAIRKKCVANGEGLFDTNILVDCLNAVSQPTILAFRCPTDCER